MKKKRPDEMGVTESEKGPMTYARMGSGHLKVKN